MNRRTVLTISGTAVILGAAGYWRQVQAADLYTTTAAASRAPMDLSATGPNRLAELVRMATLAPNSHNTQGWSFTARPEGVQITVDPARRTPVVDPDDHHLFVSLGAAVETFILAATAYGLIATPQIATDGTVTLTLAAEAAASPLLSAIPLRQSHRGLYDGTALTDADRMALLAADPTLRLIEDAPTRTALRDLTVAAYATQMADAAYRAELKSWLRFSQNAALETQDGLFSGCSGSPALPQMLGNGFYNQLVTAKGQSDALAAQIDSTPALALLFTEPDTPAGQIDTGRRLARIGLAATDQRLAMAHVNPALENQGNRAEIARLLGLGSARPSLLLRIGHAATAMPYSLRRPPTQTIQTPR